MSHPEDFTVSLDSPRSTRAARIEAWVERGGWAVAGVVLLLGLAGLFGPGLWSNRERTAADGSLTVKYQASQRYEGPSELIVWFSKLSASDSVRLAISRTFADSITAESITPQPTATEIQAENIVYTFHASDIGSGSHITYRYQHDDFGWRQYVIQLEGHPGVTLSQFVWP